MYYDQSPFEVKVEWGPRGALTASERGDLVVM